MQHASLSFLSFLNISFFICVCVRARMLHRVCGGQRVTFRDWFSPFTTWIKLKSSGLAASVFACLSVPWAPERAVLLSVGSLTSRVRSRTQKPVVFVKEDIKPQFKGSNYKESDADVRNIYRKAAEKYSFRLKTGIDPEKRVWRGLCRRRA